jgi:hypothetical protein
MEEQDYSKYQQEQGLLALNRLVLKLPVERRVFTTQCVCFLMISSWLSKRWSLSQSLMELLTKGREGFLGDCKRSRRSEHSRSTSGISQARQRFPKEIFQDLILELFEELTDGNSLWHGRQVVLIDGSTITLEPVAALRTKFPGITNQHGESAFPVALVTVAHDLITGAAFEPEIGAMYGNERDSELNQALKIYERLAPKTVVVSDSAHGVRLMAKAAIENQLDVVFEMTSARAKSYSKSKFKAGIDQEIIWAPSRHELKKYPDWKEDEVIRGRLITKKIKRNGKVQILSIFTTLMEIAKEDILSLYDRRWEVEGEIRDVKRTLGFAEVKAKTSEMVEKELLAAIVAYNLARAVIKTAAKKYDLEPKAISFKNTFVMLDDYAWQIILAKTEEEALRLYEEMVKFSAFFLKQTKKGRSFPRRVFVRAAKYKTKSPILKKSQKP